MKVAVLGDIHGNMEALKAAYHEAVAQKADRIYHLGDLGGYAPFVNEVVDFIIEKNITGVQGNYDYNVARDAEHCGCRYDDELQAELSTRSFEWTKSHATEKSRRFMASLPAELRFEAFGRRVVLFHATPHKNNLYWFEEREDRFFLEMAEKAHADVMIYGHTHKPYRRDLDGKIFVNAGSVGKPKDGDPRACLAVLEFSEEGVSTEFPRVPYDLESMAEAIAASGLPGYFAERLREGG